MWLALDTATDTVSVALHDGTAVVSEETGFRRRRRLADLARMVDRLLAKQWIPVGELSGIAVAIGPGSYSGLRSGLALAKGLALGAAIPVIGVPTLDILAAPLSPPFGVRNEPLWAVLAAGRGRIIAACYPPDNAKWPDPRSLEVWTMDQLVAAARPPAWVAGELDSPALQVLVDAGLTVLPPAAGLRRAGWLAELGRMHLASHGAPDLAELGPIYPRTRAVP